MLLQPHLSPRPAWLQAFPLPYIGLNLTAAHHLTDAASAEVSACRTLLQLPGLKLCNYQSCAGTNLAFRAQFIGYDALHIALGYPR